MKYLLNTFFKQPIKLQKETIHNFINLIYMVLVMLRHQKNASNSTQN